MRSVRLGVIVAWQGIALALSAGFGFWGVHIQCDDAFSSSLQVAAFSVCGVFGTIWFFLSVAAFPHCVSELAYAHGFTREKGTIVLGWIGILSAILAVAALGLGIFAYSR